MTVEIQIGKYLIRAKRLPYPLCWECNGRFLAGKCVEVEVEGGRVYVHKECAREMRADGRVVMTAGQGVETR